MQIGLTVTGYARLYTSIGTTGGASAYALYLYLGFIIYAWCPSCSPCIFHRGSLPHKGGLCLSIYISQANMTWDTLRRPGQDKPRRSKGCRTCLRRKVKCGELYLIEKSYYLTPGFSIQYNSFKLMFNIDERRPTCERCDKSSYACLGYGDNRLAFVHMTTGQTDYSKLEQCDEETTPTRRLLYTAGDHTKFLANLYMKASTNYVGSPLHLRAYLEEIIVSHLMWKLPVDPHEVSLDQSDLPNLSAILASCDHGSPAYFFGLSSAAALFSRTH